MLFLFYSDVVLTECMYLSHGQDPNNKSFIYLSVQWQKTRRTIDNFSFDDCYLKSTTTTTTNTAVSLTLSISSGATHKNMAHMLACMATRANRGEDGKEESFCNEK